MIKEVNVIIKEIKKEINLNIKKNVFWKKINYEKKNIF